MTTTMTRTATGMKFVNNELGFRVEWHQFGNGAFVEMTALAEDASDVEHEFKVRGDVVRSHGRYHVHGFSHDCSFDLEQSVQDRAEQAMIDLLFENSPAQYND